MDTLANEIYAALQATGYPVSYAYPTSNPAFPCISYRESLNREYQQVDGREAVTEVEYTVDIWGRTPETNFTVAAAVDTQLATLRMKRTFAHDLYEAENLLHHRVARYRALIHITRQEIYQ